MEFNIKLQYVESHLIIDLLVNHNANNSLDSGDKQLPKQNQAYLNQIISLTYIELAISEWGCPDGIAVIALHGWLDNMASYYPMIGDGQWLIDNNIRLITVDSAGHGASQHRSPAQGYPLAEYVQDLHELIEVMELQAPIIMGHSMGGAIASLYAGTEVANLSKLILIESLGPVTHAPEQAPNQMARFLNNKHRHLNSTKRLLDNLEPLIKLRQEHSQLTETNARLIIERNMTETEAGFAWRSDQRLRLPSSMYLSPDQVNAFISEINCPTLVIFATDGPIQNYPVIQGRFELLNKGTLVALTGGHHLHMENPADVKEEVIKFL